MTRGTKRLLALLLALMLCFSLIPAAALAEEEEAGTIELAEEQEDEGVLINLEGDPESLEASPEYGAVAPIREHMPIRAWEAEALAPAEETDTVYEGTCGSNLTWSLDTSTGVLTIKGSGAMTNWQSNTPAPWYDYRTSIKSVSLPSGLTSIGDFAFLYCRKLGSVTIPSKVSYIGSYAFENCYSLTSIEIPAAVTSMGYSPFYGCRSLRSISVASGNTVYSAKDGILYNESKTTLYLCPAGRMDAVTIPSTVTTIDSSAFQDCVIPSVTIPSSVTTIGSYAFSNCTALTAVKIPASVTEMGESVFSYCMNLKSIDVASSNQNYSSRKGLLYNKNETRLIQCPGGKTGTVSIPSSVTVISRSAFEYCTALTAVSIPASVTDIEEWAFDSCYSLTAINVASANPNYRSRDGILYDKDITTLIKYPGGKEGHLAIPDGVTTIVAWAFYDSPKLTGVMFPESLRWIRYGAFSWCSKNFTEIWFRGSAVDIAPDTFSSENSQTVCTYYPAGDASWTQDVRQGYGGNLDWISYSGTPGFNPFNDVKEGKYYYGPVLWAFYHEPRVTSGVSDTLFGTDQTCTRGQIVTFLWNACGQPEPEGAENPFEDVEEGKYYYKAVLWAVENGITNGVDETHFGPDNKCTRAQVVTFLWNAFDKPEPTLTTNPFEDVPEDKWYTQAVLWAVELGITSGVDASHFAPDKICTRAQVVTFLYNTPGIGGKVVS